MSKSTSLRTEIKPHHENIIVQVLQAAPDAPILLSRAAEESGIAEVSLRRLLISTGVLKRVGRQHLVLRSALLRAIESLPAVKAAPESGPRVVDDIDASLAAIAGRGGAR
jgi:hypothetical protein